MIRKNDILAIVIIKIALLSVRSQCDLWLVHMVTLWFSRYVSLRALSAR